MLVLCCFLLLFKNPLLPPRSHQAIIRQGAARSGCIRRKRLTMSPSARNIQHSGYPTASLYFWDEIGTIYLILIRRSGYAPAEDKCWGYKTVIFPEVTQKKSIFKKQDV